MLLGEFVFFFFFFFFLKSFPQTRNVTNPKNSKQKADHGFGTVCKIDAGYYSQGFCFFFFISKSF